MKVNTTRHQRGAATLVATVVLVLIASLTVLVVNKSAVNEQQRSGVDARSKEVYAAGNAALEYGMSQLLVAYNDGVDSTPFGDVNGAAVAGTTVTLGSDAFVQGIDSFTPNITFKLITAEDEHPAIIEVSAPVVGAAESHVTKTISMRVIVKDVGSGTTFSAPPLVVEKCIPDGAALGTPDITSTWIAIGTIQGDSNDSDCLNQGHFSIEGDGIVGEPLGDTSDTTLMEAMFGSGDAEYEIQEASNLEEELGVALEDRNVIYVTDSGPWGDNVGAMDSPVILFFAEASGCPAINGGTVIWGLVYYQAPDAGCDNQGTGSATVFGTVAYEGDLTKINANIEMREMDFSSSPSTTAFAKVIAPLPGSWRDFSPAGI